MTPAADLDRMRHPDEARAVVLAHAHALPAEPVAIAEAPGRVLAADLFAAEDHPPFPASTMDGYAVVAADVSPWREVIGVQNAGNVIAVEVTDGTAVRIMTGAPLPPGADAVVRIEHIEVADDHIVVHQDVITPGENIRPVGSDVRAGTVVLREGTLLGPAEIGLAASMGFDPLPVRRRPRVSVLSTGDELVEPSQPLGPGQIRDANRFSLIAALRAEGAEVVWAGKAPDERDPLATLLRERIAASDIVITSGGVSMGDLDLVKALLGEVATVHFRRVFMKPGKPLNFATADDCLIFGLPGNPVSALVAFELVIRPALLAMAGRPERERPRLPVVLAAPTPPTDRIEYQRARVWVAPDGRLMAAPTGAQQSSRLASFVGANALLIIPPRDHEYAAGEVVQAYLYAPPVADPHTALQGLLDAAEQAVVAGSEVDGPTWTRHDLLAHLGAWRARTVARLEAAAAGRAPVMPPTPAGIDPEADDADAINAWFTEQARDRSTADLLAEARDHYARARAALAAIPATLLEDPVAYPWLGGYTIGDVIRGSWEHHLVDHGDDLATRRA